MIIGGLILIGSLLNYFGAFSGGNESPWLNFFVDLISISGWFWLLIFLVVLVLVLYLIVMLVKYAFGGSLVGLIIGLSLLAIGTFFFLLGKSRDIET